MMEGRLGSSGTDAEKMKKGGASRGGMPGSKRS